MKRIDVNKLGKNVDKASLTRSIAEKQQIISISKPVKKNEML